MQSLPTFNLCFLPKLLEVSHKSVLLQDPISLLPERFFTFKKFLFEEFNLILLLIDSFFFFLCIILLFLWFSFLWLIEVMVFFKSSAHTNCIVWLTNYVDWLLRLCRWLSDSDLYCSIWWSLLFYFRFEWLSLGRVLTYSSLPSLIPLPSCIVMRNNVYCILSDIQLLTELFLQLRSSCF